MDRGQQERERGQEGMKLYMKPRERLVLPFKVQSFDPPSMYKAYAFGLDDVSNSAASSPAITSSPAMTANNNYPLPTAEGHTVTIEIRSTQISQDPMLLLDLEIRPKPIIVDRTFRLYKPERQLIRHVIHLAAHGVGSNNGGRGGGEGGGMGPGRGERGAEGYGHSYYNSSYDNNNRVQQQMQLNLSMANSRSRLSAICSNPDIILSIHNDTYDNPNFNINNNNDEVHLKYTCRESPDVVHAFILLYDDPLLTRPKTVWQIFIHVLRQVDVRAAVGQRVEASVVLRGSSNRRVTCFSSVPSELVPLPSSFALATGVLSELRLSFRPLLARTRQVKVHVVDVDTRELVYALLVNTDAPPPIVTRTFAVDLPYGSVVQKKISYANPYGSHRVFTLATSHPHLVSIAPDRFELPPSGSRPVGLTFDGRLSRGEGAAREGGEMFLDVLVFITDEDGRMEECFKTRVRQF